MTTISTISCNYNKLLTILTIVFLQCVIKSTYRERKRRPPCTEDTKLSVTVKNYRKKYKALLFYEEEEHVRLLAKK